MLDRTLRKDVVAIVIIIATSLAASSLTVFIGTSQSIQLQEQQILRLKEDTAQTLAGRFELRIEDAIKVLQIAGRSESFESLTSIDKVNDQYKGIPVTEELSKRRVADNVLSEYKNLLMVFQLIQRERTCLDVQLVPSPARLTPGSLMRSSLMLFQAICH